MNLTKKASPERDRRGKHPGDALDEETVIIPFPDELCQTHPELCQEREDLLGELAAARIQGDRRGIVRVSRALSELESVAGWKWSILRRGVRR